MPEGQIHFRLFNHIAFSFHAGAEGLVEMLDRPCLGILCLLRLGLFVLPGLATAGHCSGDSTNTGAVTGVPGDSANCCSADRPPGRAAESLATADCRTGRRRRRAGNRNGVDACLLLCPGVTLSSS